MRRACGDEPCSCRSHPAAFVRFWTKADNGRFWPAMVCPLLTQLGHGRLFRLPSPLERPGMPGTVRLSHLAFQPFQKMPTIHASSGFIRGILA